MLWLVDDGIRLRERGDFTREKYQWRIRRIDALLIALAEDEYDDADARWLAKRLSNYRDSLFTFLDRSHVPASYRQRVVGQVCSVAVVGSGAACQLSTSRWTASNPKGTKL